MRTLIAAIMMLHLPVASADAVPPSYSIGIALEHNALDTVLADPVDVKGVVFDSTSCAEKLGKLHRARGADVARLAACLGAESPTQWDGALSVTQVVLETQVGADSLRVLLELGTKDGKIIAVTGFAAKGIEAAWPTYVAASPIAFTPSDKTKAAITAAGRARMIAKLCHDSTGIVTSRRIVDSTTVPALGAEYLAALQGVTKVDVPMVLGTPLAGCQVIQLRYPVK